MRGREDAANVLVEEEIVIFKAEAAEQEAEMRKEEFDRMSVSREEKLRIIFSRRDQSKQSILLSCSPGNSNFTQVHIPRNPAAYMANESIRLADQPVISCSFHSPTLAVVNLRYIHIETPAHVPVLDFFSLPFYVINL
jgi:hypothetical protein